MNEMSTEEHLQHAERSQRMFGYLNSGFHEDSPMETMVADVEATVSFFNDYLSDLEIPHRIDEVAIYFRQDEGKTRWLKGAVAEEGVEIFNYATDSVDTRPLNTRYDVQYTFVRKENLEWRVEAMWIENGHSPLHLAVAQNRSGSFWPIHASFKCGNIAEYRKVMRALRDDDCLLLQVCESAYGLFSYFQVGGKQLALKPRVNLRDADV
jgi:hypothetical protein